MIEGSQVIAACVGALASVVFGIGYLVLGYTLGHRSGKVAGELAALKSMRRHDRSGRRPSRHAGEINGLSDPPAV